MKNRVLRCAKCNREINEKHAIVCRNCKIWKCVITNRNMLYLSRHLNRIYINTNNKIAIRSLEHIGVRLQGSRTKMSYNPIDDPPEWAIPILKKHPNTNRIFSDAPVKYTTVFNPKKAKNADQTTKCHMKGCFDRKWCVRYEPLTPADDWNTIPPGHIVGSEYCPYFIDKFNV